MSDIIKLGILDELQLTREGIAALLKPVEDIEISLTVSQHTSLLDELKSNPVNVLILVIHSFTSIYTNLIIQLASHFPRIRVLVISVSNDEEAVLKSIKAGAKGFLAKDTSRTELLEAIYSLRNGHEFFSNSITVLLLNKYIRKLKTDDDRPDIRSLSSREIEIMKMWGNSFTNKEIADKLFLSVRTVETHKNHIMQKLNLKTSVDLVKFAIRNNIIEL
jgi:DNA-binding NarL/FixJ family response regulator